MMGKVSFNVDAYTARLIGRENISGVRGALFELIKNSYDADASVCILYYSNGKLYLADNGVGMGAEVILNNWMTIGRSTKKENFTSDMGRIQTGAKGIGRFALDRLGDQSTMLTIQKKSTLVWKVDWRDFENSDNITDIKADLDESELSLYQFISENCKNQEMLNLFQSKFDSTGTIFEITELRDSWNDERFISNCIAQLSTLIPETLSDVFKLYFFTDENSIEEAKIQNEIENDYDYKLNFYVDEADKVKVKIHRNEFDFGEEFDKIINEAGFSEKDIDYFQNIPIEIEKEFSEIFKTRKSVENSIGKFSGNIYFSKINSTKKDRAKYYYKEISGRRVLEAFSGVKLYRDNFRVRPYGEPGSSNYDWLLLSSRKQKSPAAISHPTGKWKVSSDQLYGSVFISRLNLSLPDQANREGIIETTEFNLFKNFILEIVSYFENDRQYVFRKLDEYDKKINEAERIQKEIEDKAQKESIRLTEKDSISNETESDHKDNKDQIDLTVKASEAKKVIDQKDSIIRDLEDENKLLRALATTGIVTNTYIHEIKGITHTLNMNVISAYEELVEDGDISSSKESLLRAIDNKESLNSWFEVTLNSIKKDKRTWKKTDLVGLFKNQLTSWEKILIQKGISISFICSEETVNFYCHHFELESIVNNLLTNSFFAFTTPVPRDKKIKITLGIKNENILLSYEDNGPGLPKVFKENPDLILAAMESEKRDENGELIGTGMGMWIIDRTVKDYKGELDLSKNKTEEIGFHMDIILKRGGRK